MNNENLVSIRAVWMSQVVVVDEREWKRKKHAKPKSAFPSPFLKKLNFQNWFKRKPGTK